MITAKELDEMVANGDENAIISAFKDDLWVALDDEIFPWEFKMLLWTHPSGATLSVKDLGNSCYHNLKCEMTIKYKGQEWRTAFFCRA